MTSKRGAAPTRTASKRATPPPPAPRAPGALAHAIEWACRLSPLAALAALAWSLRGVPLGTPVADDFEFLARTVFHPSPDFLDSMGASYYWRPLSRQAWFGLVSPLLLSAPGVVAAMHVAILGATAFVLANVARRAVAAPAAALVAAAVIASEPARALVTWPSGIQHLLAALALVLAAHEALAGRRWTAALAAVAAALSHELGALAFATIALAGFARRDRRSAAPDVALGVALAAAWALGYRAALAHGVQWPAGGAGATPASWLATLRLALPAAFNAETLAAGAAGAVVLATELAFAASLLLLFRRSRRDDLRRLAPLAVAPLVFAWLGLVPLASLLPDWNAWRAYVPVLAIAFVVTLAAARAHPGLGLAVVALRLAALVAAEPGARVTGLEPPGVSDLSFARLARIQRVVGASGEVVRGAKLPAGRPVIYMRLPQMTINGFRTDRAVQVWGRDTSLRFVAAGGRESAMDTTLLVLSFDVREGRSPVVPLTREARRHWARAEASHLAGRGAEAYEEYRQAILAQHPESPSLSANSLQNMAVIALETRRYAVADSLNLEAGALRGPTPDGYALDALIALRRGDPARARQYLDACLGLEAANPVGQAVAREIADTLAARGGRPPSP